MEDDHIPTFSEAVKRFEQLRTQGPTPAAFNFHHTFDAQGKPLIIDRLRVRAKAAQLPAIGWRERSSDTDSSA